MMKVTFIFAITAAYFIAEFGLVAADCTAAQACIDAFPYANTVAVAVGTEAELSEYCDAFEILKSCLEPEVATCDSLEYSWPSLDARESYVCSTQGRTLFLAHKECLDDPRIVASINQCSAEYTAAIALINAQDYETADALYADVCRVNDELIFCSCAAVLPACGVEAAGFYQTYAFKQAEVYWNLYQCPDIRGSPTSCHGGVTPPTLAMTSLPPGEKASFGTCLQIHQCLRTSATPPQFNVSAEDLTDVCRGFADLDLCALNGLALCESDALTASWESVARPWRYTCGAGRSSFLQHKGCFFDSLNFNQALGTCLTEHDDGLKEIVDNRLDTTADRYRAACGLKNAGLSLVYSMVMWGRLGHMDQSLARVSVVHQELACFCKAARSHCGDGAASFYTSYRLAGQSAWREAWGCQASLGDPPTCEPSSAMLVAPAVLAVLAPLCVLAMRLW